MLIFARVFPKNRIHLFPHEALQMRGTGAMFFLFFSGVGLRGLMGKQVRGGEERVVKKKEGDCRSGRPSPPLPRPLSSTPDSDYSASTARLSSLFAHRSSTQPAVYTSPLSIVTWSWYLCFSFHGGLSANTQTPLSVPTGFGLMHFFFFLISKLLKYIYNKIYIFHMFKRQLF